VLRLRAEQIPFATDNNADLVAQVLEAACAEMAMYLRPVYDVDTIYATTGHARPPMLVKWGVDIATWELVSRSRPGAVGEQHLIRYEKAIEQLKMAAKAQIDLELPRRTTPKGDQSNTRLGSGPNSTLDSDY
jgi:phage gp36-like protein